MSWLRRLFGWTSWLNAWIRGQSGWEFDVLIGSHGNELIWRNMHKRFRCHPIQGMRWRQAHKRAARTGKRCLGNKGQIMACYPGKLFGNPEEQAAWWNLWWLGWRLNNPNVLVLDIHEGPSFDYIVVGPKFLNSAIVAAHALGYRHCIVSTGTFCVTVQNCLVLEIGVGNEAERERAVAKLYNDLADLPKTSLRELTRRYEACVPEFGFYCKLEIMLVEQTGERIERIWGILPELEAIPGQPCFTPLELSPNARKVLGVGDRRLFYGPWGYKHHAHVREGLGQTSDGVNRRECFGVLYWEISTPVTNNGWGEFDPRDLLTPMW